MQSDNVALSLEYYHFDDIDSFGFVIILHLKIDLSLGKSAAEGVCIKFPARSNTMLQFNYTSV